MQEVERTQMRRVSIDDIGAIREAVATEHELAIQEIMLIRPGHLPKTTSGKINAALPAAFSTGALPSSSRPCPMHRRKEKPVRTAPGMKPRRYALTLILGAAALFKAS